MLGSPELGDRTLINVQRLMMQPASPSRAELRLSNHRGINTYMARMFTGLQLSFDLGSAALKH